MVGIYNVLLGPDLLARGELAVSFWEFFSMTGWEMFSII